MWYFSHLGDFGQGSPPSQLCVHHPHIFTITITITTTTTTTIKFIFGRLGSQPWLIPTTLFLFLFLFLRLLLFSSLLFSVSPPSESQTTLSYTEPSYLLTGARDPHYHHYHHHHYYAHHRLVSIPPLCPTRSTPISRHDIIPLIIIHPLNHSSDLSGTLISPYFPVPVSLPLLPLPPCHSYQKSRYHM